MAITQPSGYVALAQALRPPPEPAKAFPTLFLTESRIAGE